MAIKKIRIKKYTRKVKGKKIKVKSHNRKHNIITKKQRKLFSALATLPYEAGGQMDFERGRLQNIKTHFGNDSELEFDWDPDYEISYHTHPNLKGVSIMPSFDDIISMRVTNEREQIILNKNIALSVAEKKKFRKVPLKKLKSISGRMERDYRRGMSDKGMYNKYKPIFLKELGLSMKWHNMNKEIKLDTRSV